MEAKKMRTQISGNIQNGASVSPQKPKPAKLSVSVHRSYSAALFRQHHLNVLACSSMCASKYVCVCVCIDWRLPGQQCDWNIFSVKWRRARWSHGVTPRSPLLPPTTVVTSKEKKGQEYVFLAFCRRITFFFLFVLMKEKNRRKDRSVFIVYEVNHFFIQLYFLSI